MPPLEKGLIHVYTGDGKGKTSAALGLAMRAVGRGLNVLVQQYFKLETEPSGEMAWKEGLRGRPGIGVAEGGHLIFRRGDYRHPFFDREADREVLRAKITAQTAQAAAEMKAGFWDVVVLDEVNNALRDKLLLLEEFEALLEVRPPHVELVCTGRGAPAELIEIADYVTEMKAAKHPGTRNIAARKGIEF
jgi:cob(I)alamin adenosyltransferase